MKQLKTVAQLSALLLVLGGSLQAISQEPKRQSTSGAGDEQIPQVSQEKPMDFWMAMKLEHSKRILESLTKGDFETLAEVAQQMQRLGKIEGFVRRNADYQNQLRNFSIANQELIRHAKRHNPEGAVLAFNQLSSSCVACHTLLREGLD